MIRRLGEGDRAATMALLAVAPQFNLYLLGNMVANGFERDFCEFYGDVADGRVRAVINRYVTGWTVYGEAAADWAGLGYVVDVHVVTADRLQDNPGGVASLLPYLRRYIATSILEEPLMELPEGGLVAQPAPAGFVVRKATMDDLSGLISLFTDAGDMSRSPAAVERPLRDRRVWLARKDGEVVAAALTNAETETLGMIGGVYTAPKWRGRGLSQAVCSAISEELISLGKQPTLYWQNEAAGHVYRKLGFRQIGIWRSVRLALR